MIFRPLEFALNPKEQLGFMAGSFSFGDGSFYALLGLIYDSDNKALYASCCFFSWIFEFQEVEIELEEKSEEQIKEEEDGKD